MNEEKLFSILKKVERPGRYLGNEINVIKKDFDKAQIKVCLVFPDKYEVGMSHIGLKILYDILNKLPDVVCERCFTPDLDLEKELRNEGLPLFSLESKRALLEFDLIGFSLTYELTTTNMLNILDLSEIPIWQKERTDIHPLILAGGGCTMNAEPVADFLDAAALGDGEELILDVVNTLRELKKERSVSGNEPLRPSLTTNNQRTKLLHALSEIEGIYIPSFFKPEYFNDGTLKQMTPLKEGYSQIKKRTIKEIDSAPYPTNLLVPTVKIIHDRIGIEIQRGCNRACRFCQAGYIDRPVRQRSPETVLKIADDSFNKTGINQISLLSLSAADYDCLVPLLAELNRRYEDKRVSLSVPATRTEKMTPELIAQIKKVRKTGFTIAPEAGSERMRRVINKGNQVDDLFRAVHNAFSEGWQLLKLYYMVGLPFENEEDVLGIAQESQLGLRIARSYTPKAQIKTALSSFVPKPHTPFQWEPQMTLQETREKYSLVRRNLGDKKIQLKHHNPEMSYLEGIVSRGDRRVANLIYLAFKEGCRFDEWEEHFDFEKWQSAIAQWGEDPAFYLHRKRNKDEILPWDHLFSQMDKSFLWNEYEKAKKEAFTEDCSIHRCSDCGVCDFRSIKNRIYVVDNKPLAAKKGNREWYGWSPPLLELSEGGQVPVNQDDKKIIDNIIKVRIRYSKTGEASFLGHLEWMGALKRAISRLQTPVCFSQGFHPEMKLSMGPPLPVGLDSDWEFFDLELIREIDLVSWRNDLNKGLPRGFQILTVEKVDRNGPSIYSNIKSATYTACFGGNFVSQKTESGELAWRPQELNRVYRHFQESKDFIWTREREGKRKKFNLKECVEGDWGLMPEVFKFTASVNPEGSLKAVEVLSAIFGLSSKELADVKVKKVGIQWMNDFSSSSSSS